MSYTIDRKIDGVSFEDVVERTRRALADQGFGVLTEIEATIYLTTEAKCRIKAGTGDRHGQVRYSEPRVS